MTAYITEADEVRAAESKVVEISRLQTILTANIAQQAEQIDAVYASTLEASENVVAGNDELKKAVRSSIDFRLGAFLFYLMCSLCLLFLDWYNQ